jgi:multidrug resistance efflux pump
MRRLIVIAVLVLAVVGVGVFVLRPGPGPDSSPQPTVPPVPAATTITADARVVPIRSAELGAPAGASTVDAVLVEEGATVTEGQALVRFDTRFAENDLASARATVAAAEAAVAQAELRIREADANINAAQAGLDEAEAAFAAADANRDALPNAASSAQERAADAEVDRASAGIRAARAHLSAARQARGIVVAGKDAADADRAQAQAGLDAAQLALDSLTVEAPFAGVVASIDARVGEEPAPGVPVVRIADLSGWRFETTDLDEASAARIREGATATVTADALPDTPIPARVTRISGFGESSAGDIVFRAVLEPTGAVPDGLRWNMTAGASIDLEG